MKEEKENEDGVNWDVDEDSCLFLSKHRLFRVQCPFPVVCKVDTAEFTPGQRVEVTKVTYSNEKVVLYQVFGKLFPHFFFYYKPPTNYVLSRVE